MNVYKQLYIAETDTMQWREVGAFVEREKGIDWLIHLSVIEHAEFDCEAELCHYNLGLKTCI
jgi:hypothetical protein